VKCGDMRLQPFEMERWQSIWENQVKYNLSESGVHPLKLSELLNGDDEEFRNQSLGYVQTNGTIELRKTISTMYANADAEEVLVTNGSSEANFAALWFFLDRGAEVAVMLPNYMQIWGLVKTFRAKVKPFWLRESKDRWIPDIAGLRKSATKKTKLIALCNPNNPTGATITREEVDEICAIAKKTGAWILSDEVYHGAELDGHPTPTFWDKYDKVIVTNGLSKAYGLPGLRMGWAVAKGGMAGKLWAYHDYTTISPNALSDYLARKVLQPTVREKILGRTRKILSKNLPIVSSWVDRHRDCFSFVPPKAGAIAFLKYNLKISSRKFTEQLVKDQSTLVVPGDHFGMGRYIRVGYGCYEESLTAGLNRIGDWVKDHTG